MTQSEHKRHGNGPISDLELARRVVEGHPDAQRVFAERMRCVPRMIACRNRRLGRPLRPEELEDLTQETLLRIWRKLGAFEGRARALYGDATEASMATACSTVESRTA